MQEIRHPKLARITDQSKFQPPRPDKQTMEMTGSPHPQPRLQTPDSSKAPSLQAATFISHHAQVRGQRGPYLSKTLSVSFLPSLPKPAMCSVSCLSCPTAHHNDSPIHDVQDAYSTQLQQLFHLELIKCFHHNHS